MNKYKAIVFTALTTVCIASDDAAMDTPATETRLPYKNLAPSLFASNDAEFSDATPKVTTHKLVKLKDLRTPFGRRQSEPEFAAMHQAVLREEARVAAIDGGGVKALLQLDIFAKMERKSGRHITELVDMMGGTSCGAIITLLLTLKDPTTGRPKYSSESLKEILVEKFPLLFQTKGVVSFGLFREKYKITPIREMLQELAGNAKFGDAIIPIFVTAFNISEGVTKYDRLSVLTSYTERDMHKSVVDVGLSSLSAPVAFKAHASTDGQIYLDGGLVANNPALIAYSEAKEYFRHTSHFVLLSLGAGKFRSVRNYSGLHTGIVSIAADLPAMFLEGQQSITQRTLALMDNVTSYRIDPLVDGEFIALEDTSPDTIRRLNIAGHRFWTQEQPLIEEILGRMMRVV